jgi:adenosylcobinamide-GDP ribazoletransferase
LGFFIALQFLTSLPSPFRRKFDADELGRAQVYFPLVGALLGLILVLIDVLLRAVLPMPVVGGLLVLALVLLTGGLHLDGLMDSCDGLFVQRPPAQRLDIMRDSRVGSFGVIGAVCLLILKYAGLVVLEGPMRLAVLVLMPVLARWTMVFALAAFPYARAAGKGTAFHGHGLRPLAGATLVAILLAVGLWPERGLLLFVAVALWTMLAARFIAARVGGLTGDSYGAIGETAEVVVLIGALASWRGLP